MDKEQAVTAFDRLSNSPAAAWTSLQLVEKTKIVHTCTRCGAKDTFEVPPDMKAIPEGMDEELFQWLHAFHLSHESCTGNKET